MLAATSSSQDLIGVSLLMCLPGGVSSEEPCGSLSFNSDLGRCRPAAGELRSALFQNAGSLETASILALHPQLAAAFLAHRKHPVNVCGINEWILE